MAGDPTSAPGARSDPDAKTAVVPVLPAQPEVFFDTWTRAEPLPTAAQIRDLDAHFPGQYTHLVKPRRGRHAQTILHFPALGLVVKFGKRTTVSEGQTLRMLRTHCPDVPVPEVYGWCEDQGEVFMYISHIPGATLNELLKTLSKDELRLIAADVRRAVHSIRRLRQPAGAEFVGTVSRGGINDQLWWSDMRPPPAHAFASVRDFQENWFALADCFVGYEEWPFFAPFRAAGDQYGIRFTHADLATKNILISPETKRVVGIVDWQESGWYPEYWEYLKTLCTAGTVDKWAPFVDVSMTPYPTEKLAFIHFYSTGIFS